MTVSDIFDLKMVNDGIEVYIRDSESNVLAHGNWYQDNILKYTHSAAVGFTWQSGGRIYIDLA